MQLRTHCGSGVRASAGQASSGSSSSSHLRCCRPAPCYQRQPAACCTAYTRTNSGTQLMDSSCWTPFDSCCERCCCACLFTCIQSNALLLHRGSCASSLMCMLPECAEHRCRQSSSFARSPLCIAREADHDLAACAQMVACIETHEQAAAAGLWPAEASVPAANVIGHLRLTATPALAAMGGLLYTASTIRTIAC